MSVENSTWLKYRPGSITLTVIKISIGLLLVSFLAYRISEAINTNDFFQLSFSSQVAPLLGLTILLCIVNWFLEAKKWKILASPFQDMPIGLAYKSVLAGLATGLITPNRLGNFIGRLAYVQEHNKVQATVNTQVGNLAQFIVSILLGIAGLSYTLVYLNPLLNPFVFILFPATLLILSFWLYFNPKSILKLPFGKKIVAWRPKAFTDLATFPNSLKWRVLAFSVLRYFVFIIQYYSLFILFGTDISPVLIAALAATTFLITTIIPGVFFGKLLIRESAAVFVFSWVGLPVAVILAVSFLLWLINLASPALIGWYFWIKKPKE